MKKKFIFIIFLFLSITFISFINVYAYSPHYLPGGKNYLTIDNFMEDDTDYVTINPFLVKTYTDYVITIPQGFADQMYNPITIYYYEDDLISDSIIIDFDDMTHVYQDSDNWFYYSFKTPANTNYLGISFDNTYGYFTLEGFEYFQLEEGLVFSGYEDYIQGTIIDTSAPYFQNANTIISYYDSPITTAEIQSALQAYDDIDGDVSANITLVTDNYTPNNDVLGTYNIIFEVSDSSSNSSQISIDVEVVDVLKPVFTELETIQAVYPNVYTSQDILNLLSASDNYDGDISADIVMVSDGYTTNSNIVGTYQMEFEVSDSSGNTQNYIQEIQVVDNEGPIISGITSISIGYDTKISVVSVTNNLIYNDNYDLVETLSLVLESDNYSANSSVIGNYEMSFSVTDSSGNKTTQIVTISVVDQMGPVVYFNSAIIQTYNDTVMALPDFVQLLKATNELDKTKDYYVTIKYDSYTKNAKNPGTYHLSLNLTDNVGEEITKDFEIRVIEKPYDYVETGEDQVNKPFYQEYKEYFIGGIGAFVLMISNVIWLIVFKKKK
ncbi:Ig-like domain repeat protein [Candidatus Izemoplasma sp. B36]|uniref:Ig-like domain repeat protein n=1 Tax=Candidatus Izemoplasma sp. B36 TaxID=3242468 RepID=UPI003556FC5F